MGIEATGTIHAIFETKQVSDKFTKREFVVSIADNPKYPQLVQFQLTGDRVSQLDDLREGDAVQIEFSLRGREWRSPQGDVKYFTTLDAWKVVPVAGRRESNRGGSHDAAPNSPARGGWDDNSDIPF